MYYPISFHCIWHCATAAAGCRWSSVAQLQFDKETRSLSSPNYARVYLCSSQVKNSVRTTTVRSKREKIVTFTFSQAWQIFLTLHLFQLFFCQDTRIYFPPWNACLMIFLYFSKVHTNETFQSCKRKFKDELQLQSSSFCRSCGSHAHDFQFRRHVQRVGGNSLIVAFCNSWFMTKPRYNTIISFHCVIARCICCWCMACLIFIRTSKLCTRKKTRLIEWK